MSPTDVLVGPTVEVGPTGRPIKIWARDVEDKALQQVRNLSALPFVISHVALMPDGHAGYGMPIGGVLFADKAVVPYAIGVDIGCGVALVKTQITTDDLDPARVRAFLHQVQRDVPVGNGPQAQHHKAPEGESFYPFSVDGAEGSDVLRAALASAEVQLGTLGGGNHFIELQKDVESGTVWLMLHSGSRSVGKKVCDHHHKVALGLNRTWHSALPDPELAYLPWETTEARDYWDDMNVALAWAEENRRRMVGRAISAFGKVWGADAWQVLDVHHNYAAWESHGGKNGIVHRKGAVRAREGETVLIPGSMGTASYVAEGLGSRDSFATCQHGAGRTRSRAATRKLVDETELDRQLGSVILVTSKRSEVTDEAPAAYKDIEDVMAASADLVRPVRRLLPVGVLKG